MQASITPVELREQYDLAGLAGIGISFERALRVDYLRLGLENAVKSRRRTLAAQGRFAAIPHQIKEIA